MSGKRVYRSKRKRPASSSGQQQSADLGSKVAAMGGTGFGLEEVDDSSEENANPNVEDGLSGIYGSSRHSVASRSSTYRSSRRFLASSKRVDSKRPPSMGQASVASASTRTRNPYSNTSSRRGRRSTLPGGAASVRSSGTSQRARHQPKAAVHIVCAIGENLARETCIASLDAGTPIALQVTKQSNGQTYAETLAYLEMLRPDEVLLNEGRKNSPLARKILQLYEHGGQTESSTSSACGPNEQQVPTQTVVKLISRSCFDQTKGAEMLRRLARTETYDPTLVEEYILLSSSHAVLHYTQQTLGASFSRKCLTVMVNSGGNNRMAIDRSTLLQLELLTNAKTGKTKNSLVSSIDCTKTTVGTRLLRSSLMAPPCRLDTINARLDLVDTFLENEDFFYAVLEHLQSLPAIDKMLTNIAVIPRQQYRRTKESREASIVTARLASKGISALVCVKSTLTSLPALAGILSDHLAELDHSGNGDDGASVITGRSSLLIGLGGGPASTARPQRHYLLRAIVQALSQPQLAEIRETVANVFTESTSFCRNANAMRHQECFALKSQENGMMEILRKAFLANVDDVYKKADEYAEIHGIHVSVRYSTSRGYYLSVPGEIATRLPNIFIQPLKCGNYIYCTTEEVHSLNIRAQDNVQDLLLMTYERIQEVLGIARSKYDALASLSDAIALLDLCHGFADKVTLSKATWSRPVVVDDNDSSEGGISNSKCGILIRNGRYGIDVSDSYLSSADGPNEIIPNDTYASGTKNFTVISGINGSGKSTYLKQIAIIVLLAHCGGYVPAEQASIPLRNRLCARMGTADDQENNISSFMLEMKETAYICSNASNKSLILLDELGRATSNEDGVSLAWAVSEFLVSKRAMTFFVSHYPQLCRLSQIYPSVQNQHLKASISSEGSGNIRYTHKLTQGPCTVTPDYGVEMATTCGWPADVVQEARRIESDLQEKMTDATICDNSVTSAANTVVRSATKVVLKKLLTKVVGTIQDETSVAALRSKLKRLKETVSHDPHVPFSAMMAFLNQPKDGQDMTSTLHGDETDSPGEPCPIINAGLELDSMTEHTGMPTSTKDRFNRVSTADNNSSDDDHSSLTSFDSMVGSSTMTERSVAANT